MFGHGLHFADHDAGKRRACGGDALDLEARHRQGVRERRHVGARVHPITQPVEADLHRRSQVKRWGFNRWRNQANCFRNRRSFSKYSRMSFTL